MENQLKNGNGYSKYRSRTFWIVIYQLLTVPPLAILGKLDPQVGIIYLGIDALWFGVKWVVKKNGEKK